MPWIILSPHFDDAAYSLSGWIYDRVQQGQEVTIWTVCGGEPPADRPLPPFAHHLHQRWQTGPGAVAARQAEDRAAAAALGAAWRHADVPDCIYRYRADGRPRIQGEEDLFRPDPGAEPELLARISGWMEQARAAGAALVGPAGLGGHVDHALVRAAYDAVTPPAERRYYLDFPYVLDVQDRLDEPGPSMGLCPESAPVSEAGLRAWLAAAAAYASQISTFWSGRAEMEGVFRAYRDHGGGRLWKPCP